MSTKEHFDVELSKDEVEIIIQALGSQPFARVYTLIEKLHLLLKEE